MQISAPIATRRLRRLRAGLALIAALLLAAALSAGAAARPSGAHRSSCATRHAKRGSAKHCAKRHAHTTHGTARKAKKPARRPAPPAPALTPASCEDGTPPARAPGGAYSCEDGSEPSCEDGSDPIRPSAASAPMCRVPKEEPGKECGAASGECEAEFVCEEGEEAVSAQQGCEHGSAFEEEDAES